MESNQNQNQNQTLSIDSSSSQSQSQSNQSSLPIHSESKPSIKTTTSPVILLRRHESSPNPSSSSSSSTQLKSSESNGQIRQNHTLLIDGRSIDNQITNPNLIFGSTTSTMITEEPQSQSISQSDHSSTSASNPTISDRGVDRLDATVVEAMMTGTVRDKQILLQAEVEMVRFVTSTQHRQPFGAALSTSLNSYQRMLVHRLGDSFGIKRSMDMGHMYMERTPLSACPSIRLESFIIRQDASPSNTAVSPQERSPSINIPPEEKTTPIASSQNTNELKATPATTSTAPLKTFKIMSRSPSQRSSSRQTNNKGIAPSAGSSVSSGDATNSDTKRNELSYEARQAAYQQARNRIFASETSESAEDDGVPKESSESEATSSSRNLDGSVNDDPNASNDQSVTSPNDPSSGNGPIRIAQPLNKGKEKMTASSRSAKQAAAAKLRPSATAFDPNAKAHGYEEVTIIDFDDSHGPIPWSGPTGYEYPSEPISRQAYNSRQTRPGHLYGSDAFPATLPVQHHPPCGTLNGEHPHHHDVPPYGMFSPSNGPHYLDSQSGPHPGSIMNPMVPYEHPPQRMFPPPSGPMDGDQNRQLYPQNPGFPTPTSSIPNGRSINPGTSIPPGPRIPMQHDRFNTTPYAGQHGLNNEMGVGRVMPSETTGMPMMMGNQGSDRMRGTYIPQDQHPAPPRSLTAPPPPEGHQALNFAHSLSYPSLHQISQGHNPLPPLHMNPYQTNLPSTFDQHFQTSAQSPISPINQPFTRESSGSSPRNGLHSANPQFHPPLTSQPSHHSDPSHSIDYSPVDRRLPTFNGTSGGPHSLHNIGSNNLHSPVNPFLPVPLKYESNVTYPSSSSISSSSTDSSHRTAASSLSRTMNAMKLSGNSNEGTKSMRQLSRNVNPNPHFGPIGLIVGGENGNGIRYPRPPASVGNVSSSSAGSSRRNRSKKNEIGIEEVGSMDHDYKLNPSFNHHHHHHHHQNSFTNHVGETTHPSSNNLKVGNENRKSSSKGSGGEGCAASITSSETTVSSSNSSIQSSSVVVMNTLQHPLPPKPLWVGTNCKSKVGGGGGGGGGGRGASSGSSSAGNANANAKHRVKNELSSSSNNGITQQNNNGTIQQNNGTIQRNNGTIQQDLSLHSGESLGKNESLSELSGSGSLSLSTEEPNIWNPLNETNLSSTNHHHHHHDMIVNND